MRDETGIESFRLAPMSRLISVLTTFLLALPAALIATSFNGPQELAVIGLFVLALYAWVWLRYRPTRFKIHPDGLEVVWPLRRRVIPCQDITSVQLIDGLQLRKAIGWGMRIGAGGLWGGFGWLWTKRRGVVQMYVSRTTDGFVWIERGGDRPWLITPEQPEVFVRALTRQCSSR